VSRKFPADIQQQVYQRANFLCEYCHANERWQCVRFTIDHINPISEGGKEDIQNSPVITATVANQINKL